MSIREPRTDRHRVLWVENIGRRRVINDDGFFEVTPNLGQILKMVSIPRRSSAGLTYLDIVSLMIVA